MSPNEFHYDSGDDPITKRDVDRIIEAIGNARSDPQPLREIRAQVAEIQSRLGCITATMVALAALTAGIALEIIIFR